jgi:hypothetical protein
MRDIWDIKDDVMEWCTRIAVVEGINSILFMAIGLVLNSETSREIGAYLAVAAIVAGMVAFLIFFIFSML